MASGVFTSEELGYAYLAFGAFSSLIWHVSLALRGVS